MGHTHATGWRERPFVELEVVIPALNEERRLPATLARTVEYLARQDYSSAVVVVDNGSVDRTADVVREVMRRSQVPVHLVGCAAPGKGSAVRRGLVTGRSRFVGFMDADLATPIETLDRVVPLLRSGVTTVIGSRNAPGAIRAVPQGVVRRAGGEAFRAASRTVLPGVTDSQCGFKFFSGQVVRRAITDCRVSGFSFDVELLGRLQRAGHAIVEVPVTWTDMAGSTFNPVRHGLRSFTDTVRVRRLLSGRRNVQVAPIIDLETIRRVVPAEPADVELVG
ncbi:glycosyltransferase [Geodermatophilus sp. SYSU D00758]